jgi:hypothetical protein
VRFVDRNDVAEPPSLKDPSDAVKAERKAAQKFYETFNPLAPKAKGYGFKEYKGFDVTYRLRVLFHNKCAYCESDLGDNLDVEHFRPKGGITEAPGHAGYWWLAHTWTNLLPSCTPCNQTRRQHIVTEAMTVEELTGLMAKRARVSYGKANQFPISGVRAAYATGKLEDEKPDLIDPTVEDPAPFLRWSKTGPYSVVLARPTDPVDGARALSTINVFALNRMNLVQSRTSILSELRFQAEQILSELEEDIADGGEQRHLERALRRVEVMRRLQRPEKPYSAMVQAFVDDFVVDLLKRVKRGGDESQIRSPPVPARNADGEQLATEL